VASAGLKTAYGVGLTVENAVDIIFKGYIQKQQLYL